MQNLVYTLIQIFHNFGAAAVIGFSTYGVWGRLKDTAARRRIFIFIGIAWLVQAVSGPAFGVASLSYYGELQDIHGIAIFAVCVKIICVITALILIARIIFKRSPEINLEIPASQFAGQFALGITALSAAAFLRWYS